MIRVVVVSGVRLYREGLAQVFTGGELVVVATAGSPAEIAPRLAAARADVALLDVPLESARDAVLLLRATRPALRVVALAIHEVASEVLAWAEAGVAGYVSRDSSLEELAGAVRAVARGEQACPAAISGALLRRVGRLAAVTAPSRAVLTRREAEVMALVERGLSNKEIARALHISVPTVKRHVHNVFEKLEVHRRADALARLGRHYSPLAVTPS